MKVLLCSLDSPGFLFPVIGLARALRRRHHEVAVVANIDQAEFLAKHSVDRLPRDRRDGPSFQTGLWGHWKSVALQVKHVEFALDCFPADVIVGQALTYGPLIAASRRHLPVASLGFCTYLWPTTDGEPKTGDGGWKRWRYGGMAAKLNEFRRLFHLPAFEGSCRETPLLGDCFMVRSVGGLEPKVEELPPRVHLIGGCLWEPDETDSEFADWIRDASEEDSPIVYVQHGRSFELPSFWPDLVQVLTKLGCRIVASVDKMDQAIEPIPANSWIRPHVPQRMALQHASLVVSSASTTIFLASIAAGLPCFLLPGGGEQPDVAALAEQAGFGLVLPLQEASPEKMESALLRLLTEDAFRKRSGEYRDLLGNAYDFSGAAALVECLGENRLPIIRAHRPLPWPNATSSGFEGLARHA